MAYGATEVSYSPHIGHWLEMPLSGRFQLRRMRPPGPKRSNAFFERSGNIVSDPISVRPHIRVYPISVFHPVKTFSELKAQLGKQHSGDVLAEKIIEAAKKNLSRDAIGCFAAGTLVHTREGLKPIQDIKVGDYVLAKPESGQGETAYKRVVNTFEFQNKEVWYVEYIAIDKASKYAAQPGVEVLVATPNHPFWVLGTQSTKHPALCDYYERAIWKSVEQLEDREVVLLNSGDLAKISGTGSIKKTSAPGIGWHQAQYGGEHGKPLDLDGHYVYFDNEKVRADITFMAPSHYNEGGLNDLCDYENYLGTVYNIEVEDYHTYFVGEMGVWVHNTNCGARQGGMRSFLAQMSRMRS